MQITTLIEEINDIKIITTRLKRIEREMESLAEELLFEQGIYDYKNNNKMLFLMNLHEQLLTKKYSLMEPTYTDGIIDLYCEHGTHYVITKHNEPIPIGSIEYLETRNPIPGNISYEIKKEYQGNHFALRALRIIGRALLDEGIEKIIITATNNENIPSMKTIEEFGGILLTKDAKTTPGPVPYNCDLINIFSK